MSQKLKNDCTNIISKSNKNFKGEITNRITPPIGFSYERI